MAVHLDYDRIKNRTPEEREAEDRWWASLSKEQKQVWLDRWSKEDAEKDAFQLVVGLILVVVVVVIPGLLGCIELAKMVFH